MMLRQKHDRLSVIGITSEVAKTYLLTVTYYSSIISYYVKLWTQRLINFTNRMSGKIWLLFETSNRSAGSCLCPDVWHGQNNTTRWIMYLCSFYVFVSNDNKNGRGRMFLSFSIRITKRCYFSHGQMLRRGKHCRPLQKYKPPFFAEYQSINGWLCLANVYAIARPSVVSK